MSVMLPFGFCLGAENSGVSACQNARRQVLLIRMAINSPEHSHSYNLAVWQ